jgi:hypothetical protein
MDRDRRRNTMNDELTSDERRALDALPREESPPAFLEDRTVLALQQHGALKRRRIGDWRRVVAAAAAALVLLVGGAAAGRWTAMPVADRPEFVLLLRTGQGQPPGSHEEMVQRVGEYSAWARAAHEEGLLVTGEKLTDDGQLVSSNGAFDMDEALAHDDAIEGYFLIRAPDYQQAAALASSCPHIKYGGEIELRRIHQFTEESS